MSYKYQRHRTSLRYLLYFFLFHNVYSTHFSLRNAAVSSALSLSTSHAKHLSSQTSCCRIVSHESCLSSPTHPSKDIINMVLSSGCVGPCIKYSRCYGLLLKHLKSSEVHWLHPDLSVCELTQRYEKQHLEAEWRSVLLRLCNAVVKGDSKEMLVHQV